MITVTKQSNSVLFEFENNPHYLQQGTMEVPFNSLILVEDESDMITFRKASTNDILFSAMYTEFSSLGDTKEDVVSALEGMMFAEGGGGGGVDPEDVVEIVESALTDYWTSAQTQSAINQASSGKQDTLVSGTNIKTINNESLLGSGNITISGGGSITIDPTLDSGSTNAVANSAITNAIDGKQDTLTAGTGIDITSNVISVTGGTGGASVVELTQAQYDALVDKDPDALYIITDAEEINLSGYALSSAVTQEISAAVSGKQDTLVSGTNIKTINNESLLGSGNITISGGGGGSYQYYSEDSENLSATIHIEDTDNGTVGEVYVDSSSVDVYASSTVEEEGSEIETQVNSYTIADGVAIAYVKSVDGVPTAHSYLNVNENNISLEVSSDEDHTTTFAVSNSAVTINGENVLTESDGAYYISFATIATTGIRDEDWDGIVAAIDAHRPIYGGVPRADGSILYYGIECMNKNVTNTQIVLTASDDSQHYFYTFTKNGSNDYSYTVATKPYVPEITTAITSGSTDTEIPTAKATYDAIQAGGGGATYSAGTNISIDTANTINCTIPAYFNSNEQKGDIAIGTRINNTHSDYYKVIIGRQIDTYANGNSSQSVGIAPASINSSLYSQLKGRNSVGIGTEFQITGHQSVAVGSETESSVVGGVAIGYQAKASGTIKMNLNNQIKADTNNQVYISNSANTSTYCVQQKIETTEAALGGLKLVSLTQAEYDALVTKDSTTIYFIKNNSN